LQESKLSQKANHIAQYGIGTLQLRQMQSYVYKNMQVGHKSMIVSLVTVQSTYLHEDKEEEAGKIVYQKWTSHFASNYTNMWQRLGNRCSDILVAIKFRDLLFPAVGLID